MSTIVMPGLNGSGPEHWQSLWGQADPSLTRFQPASWDAPELDDWWRALDAAVGDGPALLIAHSLSCLLAVRWAHAHPTRTAGMVLVAPPDPAAPSFPASLAPFGEGLDVRPAVPALIIASDDDQYCSAERSIALAAQWGIPRVSAGSIGHINAASGIGDWPEGQRLVTAFKAGLRVG